MAVLAADETERLAVQNDEQIEKRRQRERVAQEVREIERDGIERLIATVEGKPVEQVREERRKQ